MLGEKWAKGTASKMVRKLLEYQEGNEDSMVPWKPKGSHRKENGGVNFIECH